jgi:hypothetical protein
MLGRYTNAKRFALGWAPCPPPSFRRRASASFDPSLPGSSIRSPAGWLPGFAILTHVGRRSGRVYRTPINVFRRGDQYLFALT